jgi:hypothetical protein
VQENNVKGMWRKLKKKDVMKEKEIDYSWRERNINRMYVTQKKEAGEKEICALKSNVKENWKKLRLKPPTDREYWIRRLCTATNVVSSAHKMGAWNKITIQLTSGLCSDCFVVGTLWYLFKNRPSQFWL